MAAVTAGLYALAARTGQTVWGPVTTDTTNGDRNLADRGRIYTASFGGIIDAFDASTGRLDWTTALGTGDQYVVSNPIVAVSGAVYVSSGGFGQKEYALDGATGNSAGRTTSARASP